MSDPSRPGRHSSIPPPAPPLPPNRAGAWKRLVAPLGFGQTAASSRPAHSEHGQGPLRDSHRISHYTPLPSQTAAHRTGIPIAALDCNEKKTHAVLAGQEILKTVHIEDGKVTEEVNLRSSVISYNSTHKTDRRQFLAASDVKWSQGEYAHVIAAAAVNGPIVLYDVNKTSELVSLHEHRAQVHKLAFDPNLGRYLLSGSQDGTVKLWDLRGLTAGKAPATFKSSRLFPGRVGAIRDVRWSPTDAFEFITASDTGVIQKWDLRNNEFPALRINGHEKPCTSIDWHPDGRHVVSAGFDRHVRVWDFQSTNRRQKPTFQLRAPQAIMNVRWRPPCWSAEMAETGQWQSTQLITSYTQDDPRLHVWDLRRPHLPFRELDRYNSPATDLLWASKDLLWTVGNEGMFTQTDISFAPQVHKQLPPCALKWMWDGEHTAFVEDRVQRRESGLEDPAVGFLSVSHNKLSSGDDGAISRSLTDDDSPADGMLSHSFKRRQSKSASARSAKSQASTPPSMDGMPGILPLDKAVFERKDLFNNRQIGVSSRLPGLSADPDVTRYLANHYSQVPSDKERRAQPEQILSRLEEAFSTNADACDAVNLHRTAQSWRLLAAVIVPELREWAETNRGIRLNPPKVASENNKHKHILPGHTNPGKGSPAVDKPSSRTLASQRPTSSLLQGFKEASKADILREMDSTSNMTTPLAQPLPDSPPPDRAGARSRYHNADNNIETLPPLPPSVLTAHSTATAASKALLNNIEDDSNTPPSSPERERKDRISGRSPQSPQSDDRVSSPKIKTLPRPIQRSTQPHRQEDRRAALRDYKAQARPILTFDPPANGKTNDVAQSQRQDSAGSFPMFSASTGSSNRTRSLLDKLDSPDLKFKGSITPDRWDPSDDSDDFMPSSPPLEHSVSYNPLTRGRGFQDGNDRARQFSAPTSSQSDEDYHLVKHAQVRPRTDTSSSSPDGPFHFEVSRQQPPSRVSKIDQDGHTGIEFRTAQPEPTKVAPLSDQNQEHEDLTCKGYIFRDFRPIDFSTYATRLPFEWSSLPLVAHTVHFDLSTSSTSAQFSAHLLMLVAPYFFSKLLRPGADSQISKEGGIVGRLMNPATCHTVIDNVFLTYAQDLKRIHCYVALAELRKFCAISGYSVGRKKSAKSDEAASINGGDQYLINIVCQKCQAALSNGRAVCDRCHTPRGVCPVCLSINLHDTCSQETRVAVESVDGGGLPALWSYCQACCHSAHVKCMQEWLAHSYSEGMCPSPGCGCDCGPGATRRKRIQRQVAEEEENKLIRGAHGSSSQRDLKKAIPSAAVQKTRTVLREGERVTQSGDERGAFASRRASSRSGFAGQGHRKSVRLVTPGEQKAKQ